MRKAIVFSVGLFLLAGCAEQYHRSVEKVFGKAEEPPPALDRVPLQSLVRDAVEGESLANDTGIAFSEDIPVAMVVRPVPSRSSFTRTSVSAVLR